MDDDELTIFPATSELECKLNGSNSLYKYVFNEGGLGTEGVAVPGSKIFNIQWAEKGKIWAELSVDGESSHGARPPEVEQQEPDEVTHGCQYHAAS